MEIHAAAGRPTGAAGRNDGGPVDIVYLWVDGSDPSWRAKRQQAFSEWTARHEGELAVYGNVLGRYRDNGELRFSLRSLEKFFPSHGHVYVVTDGQAPAWLRAGEGVTIVNHRDLMPASALPVFNSGHIESYIHHIPGLSERFLYLNDDFFFGAPSEAGDWFDPLLSVAVEAFPTPMPTEVDPGETSLVNASAVSFQWLSARYPDYRHGSRLFAHAPRPMLKSAMFELERLAPELFRQVRSTVFRSWKVPPLVSDLVPRWMVHAGLARQVLREHLYICTGEPDADVSFKLLQRRFGQLPFFCINDTCDDAPADDPRLRRVPAQLEALLPTPSRFEDLTVAAAIPGRQRPASSSRAFAAS
jgi:hypothetical protein